MKNQILILFINTLLKMLTPELVVKFIDMVLDFFEKFVLGTASKVDDAVVLPICDLLRETLDIPDND